MNEFIVIDEINEHTSQAVAGIDLSELKKAITAATTAANNAKAAADAAKSVAQTAANNASGVNKIAGSMKTIPTRMMISKSVGSGNVRTLIASINGFMLATDNANVSETLFELRIIGDYMFTCEVEIDGKNFSLGSKTYSYKILLPTGIKINSFKIYATSDSYQTINISTESDTHMYFEYY